VFAYYLWLCSRWNFCNLSTLRENILQSTMCYFFETRCTYNTGEHCVKISAYSDRNCRRRSTLKNCGQTDRQTDTQSDTSTDNTRVTEAERSPTSRMSTKACIVTLSRRRTQWRRRLITFCHTRGARSARKQSHQLRSSETEVQRDYCSVRIGHALSAPNNTQDT